ncbi:MAG TPA: dockerin type I domain-containing protein [Verrucomicrobiae bacterium]|nr:dockerin type I domain-containing protein [Verrucomicrobiae bacterium]
MKRLASVLLWITAVLIPWSFALAQSQTSAHYQNTDSSVIPMTISAQSAHYSIDGSVEPIVGVTQSNTYTAESGAQADPGTTPVVTPPTTGGGGSGGGGPIPGPSSTTTPTATGTLTYVWVYRSSYNGTPLRLGDNLVGNTVVHRRLIGDVNDNRVVDDIDLSLFTRYWKSYDRQGDFNEDGLIDDIDLSLFASHWAQRY